MDAAKESSGTFSVPFEKLRGRENFIDWRFQMRNYLKHDNLWCAVAGYPEGDETSESVKVRKDERV